MPKPLEYNATITSREDHTSELSVFRVRHDTPMEASPPFLPGQYVALGLNNDKVPELGSVRRSMSIASAPEEGQELEFYIRWVKHPASDNPLTHLMWDTKVGDRMFMTRKPVGKFTLPDTIGADAEGLSVLVAAGTGLAPFVSMARSEVMRNAAVDLSHWVVLHGASYPADLVYRDELAGYAKNNGMHYFPTVSRPQEAPDWDGDVGRVEDYFKPERLAELEGRIGLSEGGLDARSAGVLICGLQGTIAQTIIRLAPRGFIPDNRRIRKALEVPEELDARMWWEQYDKEPVIDLKDPTVVEPLRRDLHGALG